MEYAAFRFDNDFAGRARGVREIPILLPGNFYESRCSMTEDQSNDQGIPATPPASSPEPAASAAQQTQPQPQQPPAGQPAQPQQPPAYQAAMPQQPPMGQAPMPQPVYPPAPLMQLTGGMKFGWFVVGALLGIGGIVVSWLVNVDKMPQVKSEALKWTIIGFAVWVVLGILLSMLFAGMIAALVAGAAGSCGYSYYGSW